MCEIIKNIVYILVEHNRLHKFISTLFRNVSYSFNNNNNNNNNNDNNNYYYNLPHHEKGSIVLCVI